MPLSDSTDPIVREILRIRRETHSEIRRLYVVTGVLLIAIALSVAASLYLRSRDLANSNHKAAIEQVSSCFRSANSRPELISISRDPTLSDSVRGFVRAVTENTPKVSDCVLLAQKLHTPIPKEFQ